MGAQHELRPILGENWNTVQYGAMGEEGKWLLVFLLSPGPSSAPCFTGAAPAAGSEFSFSPPRDAPASKYCPFRCTRCRGPASAWEPSPGEYCVHYLNTRCQWGPLTTFPCYLFQLIFFSYFVENIMGVFPMEKNPHVSISVEVIYGETQHKNTLL